MSSRLHHAAGIAFLVCLAYGNALANGFALDDYGLILHNRAVRQFDLAFIFLSDYWAGHDQISSGLFRPLTLLSFALEFRLFSERPAPYHLTNLLLHLGICLLVYEVVRTTFGAGRGLLTALLFAAHPIHTEAVSGIAGRADLLSSLGLLAALLSSLRPGARHWAPLFFALALLAKEQAFVFPALLLCFHWLAWKRNALDRWPRGLYGAHAAVVLAWLAARQYVLGHQTIPAIDPLDNPLVGLDPALRLLNAGLVALRYLLLLVFPHPLSVDYSFDAIPLLHTFFAPELFALIALILALAWTLWRFYKLPAAAPFAVAWMLLSFALVSNIFFPIGTIMAERLAYLPSLGFCLLLATWLQQLGGRRRAWAPAAVLIALYVGHAAGRNGDWRDNFHLFKAAVAAKPQSAKAHQALGTELKARGQLREAVAAYQRAVSIYPQYALAHYNLGVAYGALQQYDRALKAYREAVRLRPDDVEAYLNLGAAHHALGRLGPAVDAYRQTLRLAPDTVAAWLNLGHALFALGHREAALEAYGQVLQLEPRHPARPLIQSRGNPRR